MERMVKGLTISQAGYVQRNEDGTYGVRSQSIASRSYTVDLKRGTCTCLDFDAHHIDCKHIYAVRFHQGESAGRQSPSYAHPLGGPTEVFSSEPRPAPRVGNSAYNRARMHEREHFELLLRDLCRGIVQPPQTAGRPRMPLASVVYAGALKTYVQMSGARAMTDVRRALGGEAPHYNTVSKYFRKAQMVPLLRVMIQDAASPLVELEDHFAIDATGFSTRVQQPWRQARYGYGNNVERKKWIKLHAAVGVKTKIITAAEVTPGNTADVQMLPELLSSTARNFDMKSVSADKAYLSRQALLNIEAHGAQPYIPMKEHSSAEGPQVWRRLWHLFSFDREEFLKHYHKRSNVESVFGAIKTRFAHAPLTCKEPIAQMNEVLLRVLTYNLSVIVKESYRCGIDPTLSRRAFTQAAREERQQCELLAAVP